MTSIGPKAQGNGVKRLALTGSLLRNSLGRRLDLPAGENKDRRMTV